MIKQIAFAVLATATVGVTAVPAQTVEFGGRGGPTVDFGGRRDRDYRRDEYRDGRDRYSERSNCRTVTVREQDDYGRTVTKTRRDC